MEVNNTIYETYGHTWWSDDAGFNITSLRYGVNPSRYAYFKDVLSRLQCAGTKVLDVGCGGGFLSEEFAKDGFEVTGLDSAISSIQAARSHAAANGLAIEYRAGKGESLPFDDASFDIVACCDVLEHVDDACRVIGEISRVLRKGGIFLYDTVNRTLKSKLVLIKLWQDWGVAGCSEKNLHVWEKFIEPDELKAMMLAESLVPQEMKGLSPTKGPLGTLYTMYKIRSGRVRGEAIAQAFSLKPTDDLSVSYLGWALKK